MDSGTHLIGKWVVVERAGYPEVTHLVVGWLGVPGDKVKVYGTLISYLPAGYANILSQDWPFVSHMIVNEGVL